MAKNKLGHFKWRGRNYPIDADKAHRELERVRKKFGALDAQSIVDESRSDISILHPAFEWDDSAASEAYRRHQAQTLVRCIVRVAQNDEADRREYVLVNDDVSKGKYLPMDVVVNDVDLFVQAIAKLQSILSAAERSLDELESLAQQNSHDPERLMRLALAAKALLQLGAMGLLHDEDDIGPFDQLRAEWRLGIAVRSR